MNLDPIVTRRFQELAAKGDAVAVKREHSFTSSDTGKRYYKIPAGPLSEWGTNVLNLLQRVFGEESVHYRNFAEAYGSFKEWESEFEVCRSLFQAAREDWEGGYLFNVRSLIKAEVLSDALNQAKDLLAAGYKDPACILARVALEVTLKDLSGRRGVPVAKMDKMNADLYKAGVYNMVKQKQITAWADLGNKAAHGEWNDYSVPDVEAMVRGVEDFLSVYL